MVTRVTDTQKMVTDPVLLSNLAKQGIDKNYVEFTQDYAPRSLGKAHSPYAKFYRDLKSNKRFMVVSGLPMVTPDGVKIEAGWDYSGGKYRSKANLFSAEVNKNQVKITCLYDQPDSRKANDYLQYQPQLFLDGVEQTCGKASLLPIDPINPNISINTLEWNYGICKRHLRLIQGRIHGYWIFPSNPNGEVRIKYNQTGDFKLKLGKFKLNDDEEVIPADVFSQVEYPFTVGDSATFYPDANPESTSVDGQIENTDANWATCRTAAAGDSIEDSGTVLNMRPYIYSSVYYLTRSAILFDTSALTAAATISAAVLSLYMTVNDAALSLNIYSSTPASNTALVVEDYDQFGTTAFSTTKAQADLTTGQYADFTLNASGLAAISKTSISKFAGREVKYDIGGSTPTSTPGQRCYASEQGAGYKPTLVVTYTTPTDYPINSSVLIGVLTTASKIWGIVKSSSVLIGVLTTASRAITVTRSASVLIGELVSASKSWGVTVSSSVLIGTLVSASKIRGTVKSASVSIGVLVSASRAIAVIRSASVLIGNLVSASRVHASIRSATVNIGTLVSATRVYGLIRTASVSIGVRVLAFKWLNILTLPKLTLRSRGRALTLGNRDITLSLDARGIDLSLGKRDIDLTLHGRGIDLTLPGGKQ